MGRQSNKVQKRKRRERYITRKKDKVKTARKPAAAAAASA
jgi:hypothetical protein